MKFNQDNLLKLGLGGLGGYFLADYLLPKRGFASSCPSGKYWRGTCCNHISNDKIKNAPDADDAAKACGWTFSQEDDYWRWASSDPHGAVIGLPYQTAKNASSWNPNTPGGGGGFPDLSGIPSTIFGIATPIVVVGGLVALILLTKR